MVDLFGNQPDSHWGWTTLGAPYNQWGTRFQVTSAGAITRVGYFRDGTGASWEQLRLYGPGATLLWTSGTPTDSGAVGWQWTTVDPPIAAATGTTYTVAASFSGSKSFANNGGGAVGRLAAPAPFLHDDVPTFDGGTVPGYPPNANNGQLIALGATWEEVAAPPPGPGEGDPALTGDLNSWLSADPAVQTHETDGLPWLTKEQLNALAAAVDLIPKALDTNWTKVHEIWQFAGDLTDVQLALWRAFMDRAGSQLTGPTAGGGSAFHGPGGIQVSAAAEEILLAVDKLWHRTQTTNWLEPLPSAEWIKQDELAWSGPVGWNQEADVYVIHITEFPVSWDQQDVDGKLWLPRAAWWAPLTGTLPHERHFVDFEFQILHALPMRASGLLLCPREGFAGTLEAWTRPDV